MERTSLANASVSDLKKQISTAKKNKKYFEDYLENLNRSYSNKEITDHFYIETIHKYFDGRTIKEWIDYYNLVIELSEKELKRRRKKSVGKIASVFLLFSFILLAFLYLSAPSQIQTTGFAISEAHINQTSQIQTISNTNYSLVKEQQQAILGQPVIWEESVSLEKNDSLKILLPSNAKNISIHKMRLKSYSEKKEVLQNETSPFHGEPLSSENTSTSKQEASFRITGNIISSQSEDGFLTKIYKNLGKLTGQAIQDPLTFQEIEVNENSSNYEITYETPSPYSEETILPNSKGKQVRIIGPENIHYQNVLSFTELDESLNIKEPSQVKIYWEENDTYVSPTKIKDTNNNGIYDYIEWVTPHLSTQTFNIIVITKAEHLDSNKEFISDIYEEVKKLDGIWSEPINENEFARITFETNLTNEKDITIYPRIISGEPKINIYEVGESDLIAQFTDIISNQYNKVFLSGLDKSQDTFDLQIIEGSLEFDHIIDPSETLWADSHITGSVSTPANALGQTDNSWTTDTGGTSWTSRFSLGNPSGSLTGTQTINILVRPADAGANGDPSISVELYESGALVSEIVASTSILNDAGNTNITGTFDGSAITNEGNVEINVIVSSSGGGPNANTLQMDSIMWNASTQVVDTASPQYSSLTESPSDSATYSFGQTYGFNSTWTDDASLDTVIIEFDGTNYTVSESATANVYSFTISDLAAGSYNYYWWANDTSGNSNQTNSQSYTINKATPTGTLTGTSPITYPTSGDVQGSETNSGDGDVQYKLYRNGTEVSNPDTSTLVAGTYGYVYNTTGGINYSSSSSLDAFELSVNQNTGTCDVLFNETSPITYPNTFLVWSDCNSDFTLYRNGTGISNNSEQTLAAGTYNFTVIRTDQENYTNVYSEQTFSINKATTSLSLTGTSPITYPTSGDVQGSNCPSQLTCNLYREGAGVSNPDTSTLAAGTYSYIYNTTGNENYTSDTQTFDLTVNSANPTLSLSITNATYPNDGTINASESNTGDGDLTYNLYIDNVFETSGSNIDILKHLAAGTYSITYNTTGGENYTSNSITKLLTIFKATPTASLTNDRVWTFTYDGTPANIGFSESNTGDSDATYILWKDNVNVGSSDSQSSAGTFNYKINTTGGENYTGTDNLDTNTLTINKASSEVNTFVNNSRSNITIESGAEIYLNVTQITGDSGATLELYNNGTLINQGTSQLSNLTLFDTAGTYNITGLYLESENYIGSVEQWNVSVESTYVPPSLTSVILNATDHPSNQTTANLTAWPQEANNTETLIYDWRVDDSSLAVLNMPFDTNDSSTTRDYSIYGNNGTISGATWNSSGISGGAYYFDGNDYINLGSDPEIDITQTAFTFEAWAYITDKGADRVVIEKGADRPDISLRYDVGEDLWFFTMEDQSNNFYYAKYTQEAVSANTWYHLVGVYNGSDIKIYVNGIQGEQTASIPNIKDASNNNLTVGRQGDNNARYFQGLIDSVNVYNRSLSSNQIQAIYNTGVPRYNLTVSDETQAGENWSVAVTPNDGIQDGETALSNGLIISNSAPSVSSVLLNATSSNNFTSDNLTAWSSGISDLDNDDTTLIHDWRVNDSSLAVLNMPFDTNDSSTTRDYSTYGNNGSVDATWNSSGISGGAYYFDGASNIINVNHSDSLNIDGDKITLVVWVYPTANGQSSGSRIISKYGTTTDKYALAFRNNGGTEINTLRFHLEGQNSLITGNNNLTLDSWNFVVGTYNGSQRSIYVNGELRASDTISGNIETSTKNLTIGAPPENPIDRRFTGLIDGVMVLNKSLSQEQIISMYNTGVPRYNLTVSQETTKNENWSVAVTPNDGIQDGETALSNNVTIQGEANTAPTIDVVESISAQNPTDDGTTSITFYFTATDGNGVGDLNDSTAQAHFQRAGEPTRSNESCVAGTSSGNSKNYTCIIDMWYFDQAGSWTINVSIEDSNGELVENSSSTFTYNLLTAMKMSPTSLAWPEVGLSSTDISSNNDPVLINNTGNDESLNVNITAYDLQGEITNTEYIFANNFTIDVTSEGCSGSAMANATSTQITGATLTRGNHTVNDGSTGQEELYFCLKGLPQSISSQSYSSSGYGAWEIRILLVAVIPRKRKKKRKKKKSKKNKEKSSKEEKEVEDDKLFGALDLITDRIKEDLELGNKEITVKIIERLSDKYGINKKELSELMDEKIKIPSVIFSKEMGALESLVKYMKENLKMNYKEISEELGRNERTIWTSYQKAVEKKKEKFSFEKEYTLIPLFALKNEKLTILESLIKYLKEKGFKFSEMESLIGRDQRNIWTTYSRVKEKIDG